MRTKFYALFSLLLVAGLLLTGCAGVAAAQSPTPAAAPASSAPRTISVNGSGKAFLDPDLAYIYIGVHTEGEDAAEAVTANNDQVEAVKAAIVAFGVEEKDIQTTNFSIWPQQQYDPQGQVTGTRYAVDNTVYVTLRDLTPEKLGDLLTAAIEAGANSINGIQYDVSDRTSALSEARQQAVEDAGVQAQELAEAAGVELGQIFSVSTVAANFPGPMYAGMGGGGGAMDTAASVPVSPGQLVIQVDVTVTYEIQ